MSRKTKIDEPKTLIRGNKTIRKAHIKPGKILSIEELEKLITPDIYDVDDNLSIEEIKSQIEKIRKRPPEWDAFKRENR